MVKSSRFLVLVLFVTVVALTGLNIYQGRVIQRQSDEIRWLMTHGRFTVTPPVRR